MAFSGQGVTRNLGGVFSNGRPPDSEKACFAISPLCHKKAGKHEAGLPSTYLSTRIGGTCASSRTTIGHDGRDYGETSDPKVSQEKTRSTPD